MQIRFSFETKYGTFSDALNLPDDHEFSDQEILAMQEQRRDNWIAYVDNPQVESAAEPVSETPTEPVSETPTEPIPETTVDPAP
jgi:hypothetical protein